METLFDAPIKKQSTHTKADWDIVNAVRKDEKSIVAFMRRVADSRAVKAQMPNTQQFIASLYQQASRNRLLGKPLLTPDQGVALDKTIMKYAPLMAPLLAAEKNGVKLPDPTRVLGDDEIERKAIQSESVQAQPDDAPLPSE